MDNPVRAVTAPRQAWAPWNAEHYGPAFCYPLPVAADLIGATPEQVLTLLDERRRAEAAGSLPDWALPAPVPPAPGAEAAAAAAARAWRRDRVVTAAGQPAWVIGRWLMWAWQLGCHRDGYEGTPVIGTLGLAKLTGRRAQSLRKVGLAGPDNPTGLPRPVLRIVNGAVAVNLFDPAEALRWCVWTGRVHPVTLAPLRGNHPGRGVAVDA
jgi:hypothetical protein